MRVTIVLLLLAFLGGCSRGNPSSPSSGGPGGPPSGSPDASSPPGTPPASCTAGDAACKQYGCANVIDAVMVPTLACNGFAVTPEDAGVLCRRMAIDLTGITPATGECGGKTPAQLADYFMNKPTGINAPDGSPPYVFVNRRWWAESFLYKSDEDSSETFWGYVEALDQIVSDLYSGKIMYDEFAKRALASQAFARRFGIFEANHDLVQIASQAYRVFFGREALPSEAADFGNLWRAWRTNYSPGGFAQYYPNCSGAACQVYGQGLDPAQCAGANGVSCESTVLGAAAVIPSVTKFTYIEALPAADQLAIQTPGKLMSESAEFAEAAVDRALYKYLGWWKAGWYRPDFDMPAVRDALVKKFVADGFDIRKMEKEIVTSVLYTQAAALQADQSQTAPVWAFGPTKSFYAEAWLDSVAVAFKPSLTTLPGCDFRFNMGFGPYFGGFPGAFATIDKNYQAQAQGLGGCPNGAPHSDFAGLVVSINKRTLLANACKGAFTAPTSFSALVDLEYAGIGRPASAAEKTAITARMGADDGCPNLSSCNWQQLTDGFCISLYASTAATYY